MNLSIPQNTTTANTQGSVGSRGGVVKTNSVQMQFAELTRERESLRQQARGADANRKVQENSIQALREMQKAVSEEIRVAKGTLGLENKKRLLLQQEQQSKTALLQQERQEIAKLNHDLVQINKVEKASKLAFIKEMTGLNEDMEDALRQEEEGKLRMLVTVPSVHLILDTLKTVDDKTGLTQEEREVLAAALLESLAILQEATEKNRKEVQAMAELEEKAHDLRMQAMKGLGTTDEGSKPLGEPQLDELEHLWEQNWNADEMESAKANTIAEPLNMKLFYGEENPKTDETSDAMSVDAN